MGGVMALVLIMAALVIPTALLEGGRALYRKAVDAWEWRKFLKRHRAGVRMQ